MANRRVWKYPLELRGGRQVVHVPVVGTIVHIHSQHAQPVMWLEVNDSSPMTERAFYVVATGLPIPVEARRYVGTIHIEWTVWHVYEDPYWRQLAPVPSGAIRTEDE